MELSLRGIADETAYNEANVSLPGFDVERMQTEAVARPRWIHIGPGNIFRVFPARIAHDLLSAGEHWPITAVVGMAPEELDLQLGAHDLMTLSVTLHPDGRKDLSVIAGIGEGLAWARKDDFARLHEIIARPEVTLLSLTVTEKGYSIHDSAGKLSEQVREALEADPTSCHGNTMANVAGLLVTRYRAGGSPINLISFDNFSHNGDKLRDSVLTILRGWADAGRVEPEVATWASDPTSVAFPITVIDKITPRPSAAVADNLRQLGFTDMDPVMMGRTPLAGFVNTEPTEYLLIEDVLVGDVPNLGQHGVIITSRQVCDDFENMKVTTCLNPLHTALAVAGGLLGYDTIDEEMSDPDLVALVERLGWTEGLPVVIDPEIVSPRDFLTEVLTVRFPNSYLPDDPARIAMDTSQKVGIRFGQTISKYIDTGRSLEDLRAIPMVFALWLRYLLEVDDEGQPFDASSDPLLDELKEHVSGLTLGTQDRQVIHDCVSPILSNPAIFGRDLYSTPIGERVEELLMSMLAGTGAVRSTLEKNR